MEEISWNLRPYHDELLKIFRVFESVCNKHGLRYYADGGTALGAVRHKGFIPWDDDLDVNMPREDYNKLMRLSESEFPKGYEIRRGGETVDSPIYFAKFVSTDEGAIERLNKATNLNYETQPFIDIFALDGVPDKVSDMAGWWRGRRLLRLCQLYRYPQSAVASGSPWCLKMIFARVLGFFVSFFVERTKSNEDMMFLMDKYAMKWPFADSKTVVEPAFYKGRTWRLMPKTYFDPAKPLPFEDGTIMCPAQVENFLERSFGEYLELPPLEHRIPEHALKKAANHL